MTDKAEATLTPPAVGRAKKIVLFRKKNQEFLPN